MGTQFKGTIQIGVGCKDSLLKSDGDILFATHSNALLISEDKVYLNGKFQGKINNECWQVIRNALLQVYFCVVSESSEREACKKDVCMYCAGHCPNYKREVEKVVNTAGNYVHCDENGEHPMLCRASGIFVRENFGKKVTDV